MKVFKRKNTYFAYLTQEEIDWLSNAYQESGIIVEAKDGTSVDVIKSDEHGKPSEPLKAHRGDVTR